jgi:hypothetical protein
MLSSMDGELFRQAATRFADCLVAVAIATVKCLCGRRQKTPNVMPDGFITKWTLVREM